MSDVAIVGAGAAGLAAAAILRASGRTCLLLEAGERIGGRAHTLHPTKLGGARFDAGATWLHQTDRNPLVALARARGIELTRAHQGPYRLFVDDRPATDDESQSYEAAQAAWQQTVRRSLNGADCSLADAAQPGRWTANIENWEGAIIAAADADQLSLQDWHRNQLDENDLSPPVGIGTLLSELLGPLAGPVQYSTPIDHIEWHQGAPCHLHGPHGTVTAASVIVTVSTGVLRARRITFDPPLPRATQSAIDALPMGLLNKLALPATGPDRPGSDRLGLEAGSLLERHLARRGRGAMLLSAWPHGLPYVTGFYGGRYARAFTGRPQAALVEAHGILCRLLGPRAAESLDADAGLVIDWGADPLFEGAYAYCPPGQAGARARLTEPLDDRLIFAGEACRTDGLAGTVGGALLDGERAAHWLLRRRFDADRVPNLSQGFPPGPSPV